MPLLTVLEVYETNNSAEVRDYITYASYLDTNNHLMSTRRLQFSPDLKPTVLDGNIEGVQEIEVPAGESYYKISQKNITEVQEYVFHLRHPESQVLITGMVEAAGETASFLKTRVIHHAPRTKAETLVKTLSRDHSHPHYEGLISIEKDAHQSESYLNHHSLLLGTTAKSWTLPSLEIKANDVKCSHAATMKTITEQDLFYLRARGISKQAAENVLIEAFCA